MPQIHLAVDIGASGGRHIAGWRERGEMRLVEIYRFKNGATEQDGALVWDADALEQEVLNGFIACNSAEIVPDSVGIDTWGVDYALLDKNGALLPPVYCYRDARGADAAARVHESIPFPSLYARTGIQYQPFNTVYQLYADKLSGRLDRAADFLLLPSYLAYRLTGVRAQEYTDATTTGLINAGTRHWDAEILRTLGLPEALFARQPVPPGTRLGRLLPKIAERVGFSCDVILPATHDTGAAVAALPEKGAYLSSGTWSLLGAEVPSPVVTDAARKANFTNEGGVSAIRLQKNIMGLWLVQCLKREWNDGCSFAALADMARAAADFDYRLDVNAERYLAPRSVRAVIDGECREKGFPVPQTPGQYAHAVFSSLAHAYADALTELETVAGRRFATLCILGGGSKNTYLNALTQRITGRKIILGPSEATALGNILLQEAAYV